MNQNIQIFDTTLRDGSQMPGINFSAREKIEIAKKLDEIGFHYIEGGWPGANPKDSEFFELAKNEKWKNAKICAFGSTHHKKYTPEEDPILNTLLESEAKTIVLFGKSSRFQAEEILQVSAEKNLKMIEKSVRFFTERGREVIFDAEHFFDGFFEDAEYAIQCILAAEKGGAMNITLADTNGGMLPQQIREAIETIKSPLVKGGLGDSEQGVMTPCLKISLGIHVHNDGDLAVANTLEAVRCGVTLVQGTINGLGERCGNANLCSIIPNLQLKMGFDIFAKDQLKKLTEVSRFVQELANMKPRKDLPFVGHWAFRHKGGIHASAIRKNRKSYEHIPPEIVGNTSSMSISEQSGRANILDFLERKEMIANPEKISKLLKEIKDLEGIGLSFEDAEASLEVLSREILEDKELPFHIENFFVRTEQKAVIEDPEKAVEATVQTQIGENAYHTAGLGNGPVNALDIALRKALEPHFLFLKDVELTDFKVRILDMNLGTSAKIRVQIQTEGKNGDLWRTVGCSQNIIAASMESLLDSYIYAIWKEEK